MRGGVFSREEDRARPFPADGQALNRAQHDDQDRRQHADRRCRGDDSHQGGPEAHPKNCRDEGCLAPEPVPEIAEDDRADRTRDERHAQGRERGDRSGDTAERRKEDLGEDQRGRDPVKAEVVGFDQGSDETREGDAPERPFRSRRAGSGFPHTNPLGGAASSGDRH